jgi:hypothetical protein
MRDSLEEQRIADYAQGRRYGGAASLASNRFLSELGPGDSDSRPKQNPFLKSPSPLAPAVNPFLRSPSPTTPAVNPFLRE